eukprot:TRINITY_DN39069_c0_g1_i1.p2 TRINITY_DN39069_c0_g1~~TRINITY_DN39069_c0_g1_i1.p2  ORF type:complete len:184 (+),score=27.72 TRINITY_DN39069_c0_g1_i1:60-611(+)
MAAACRRRRPEIFLRNVISTSWHERSFQCSFGGSSTSHRSLFHELRRPSPISLTINERSDWPLTDLEVLLAVKVGGAAAMDSASLVRFAEQCERRRIRCSAGIAPPLLHTAAGSPQEAACAQDRGGLLSVDQDDSQLLVVGERTEGDGTWDAIAGRFIELGSSSPSCVRASQSLANWKASWRQ